MKGLLVRFVEAHTDFTIIRYDINWPNNVTHIEKYEKLIEEMV